MNESPPRIDELEDDCACTWSSPSGSPGWTLEHRHPGCTSAVHERAAA